MGVVRSRTVLVTALAVVTLAVVSAQITFSRDWTGGKRAAAPLALDCGQFARLCRHFLHEMKASMALPGAGARRHRDDNDAPAPAPPLYDDE